MCTLLNSCVNLVSYIQVLSNSVGKAFELAASPGTEKTAEFVQIFDKFFDCLNVSNFVTGWHSRNDFKLPYRSGTDFRIKVKLS